MGGRTPAPLLLYAGYTLTMPPSTPEPEPSVPLVADAASVTVVPPVAPNDEAQADAGKGVLLLLMAAIFGFATCVTMLGPLLIDLGRDLDITLGQAGLLAAAMAAYHCRCASSSRLSSRFHCS